ncbi:MAG TPA: hypothetical protein VNO79_10600 [Actinomycetota bacterium]|nr:hypothetical protein [Actinomycetota bacterium]
MARYRKKPVVVDAIQNDGERVTIARWLLELGEVGTGRLDLPPTFSLNKGGSVYIRTLEGTMRAEVGDWIVRGVQGEFYPVKPDIFEATYEPVEDNGEASRS